MIPWWKIPPTVDKKHYRKRLEIEGRIIGAILFLLRGKLD